MVSLLFILIWISTTILGYYLLPLWYLTPIYFILGYPIGILVFAILLVLLMPLMKFTKVNSKLKYHLTKSFARFLNLLVVRIKIKAEGLENIPKNGKLTVYANHKSQTDPLIIMSIFNRGLAFTPKISLYKIPLLAQYMNYIGCFPIDRDNNRRTAKTMIQAVKNVENEYALLIFPEAGIKTRETELMLESHGGAFKIGMKAESDFLPITINGASKFSKRKWWQFLKIKVVVHPLIKYEDVKELTTQELADKMLVIINSRVEE